jgi:transcriptional regulator with XRE-family HTH domain
MTDREATPLTRVMATRGLTSQTLAARIGVSAGSVRHWKRGRHVPQYPTAVRAAKTLGVSLATLWPSLTGHELAAAADVTPTSPTYPSAVEPADRLDRPVTPLTAANMAAANTAAAAATVTAKHPTGQLTARVLADAAGVSLSTASRWLHGRTRPNPVAAAALAAAGLSPSASTPEPDPAVDEIRPLTVREVLALPTQHAPKWRKQALCTTSDDPDLWWPEPEDTGLQARLICAQCPVIAACRDNFLAQPWSDRRCVVAGVWGETLIIRARQARRAHTRQTKEVAA